MRHFAWAALVERDGHQGVLPRLVDASNHVLGQLGVTVLRKQLLVTGSKTKRRWVVQAVSGLFRSRRLSLP